MSTMCGCDGFSSSVTAFFEQRISFWNMPPIAMANCGSKGGVGCHNKGGRGNGERATFMAMARTVTMKIWQRQ